MRILTTSRSGEESDTARSCLEKMLARKGWGTRSFSSPWTDHCCDGVALQQRPTLPDLLEAFHGRGKTSILCGGQNLREEKDCQRRGHRQHRESEGSRGKTQFAGKADINMTTHM